MKVFQLYKLYKSVCAHLFFQGRVPVLVAVLLHLSPHLHRMVGVGLGQGLGGVQAQVDVTRLRTNQRRLLSVSSQSEAVIISQQPIRGRYYLRHAPDDGDGSL